MHDESFDDLERTFFEAGETADAAAPEGALPTEAAADVVTETIVRSNVDAFLTRLGRTRREAGRRIRASAYDAYDHVVRVWESPALDGVRRRMNNRPMRLGIAGGAAAVFLSGALWAMSGPGASPRSAAPPMALVAASAPAAPVVPAPVAPTEPPAAVEAPAPVYDLQPRPHTEQPLVARPSARKSGKPAKASGTKMAVKKPVAAAKPAAHLAKTAPRPFARVR